MMSIHLFHIDIINQVMYPTSTQDTDQRMVTPSFKSGETISLILEMISDAILVVSPQKHTTLLTKICGAEVQSQMLLANQCLFQYHSIDNRTHFKISTFGIIMSLCYLRSHLIGDQLLEELE